MVEGFKENVKARLWQRVAICEIRSDASLSVCACRPPSEASPLDVSVCACLCVSVCVCVQIFCLHSCQGD